MHCRSAFVQALTVSRVAASLGFVSVALLPSCTIPSIVLFCLAQASDLADGALARRWGLTTSAGASLDAFADKSLSAASALFAVAVGMPAAPCLMVLIRDLLVTSLRSVSVDGHRLLAMRRSLGILTAAPMRAATCWLLVERALGTWRATYTPLLFWAAGACSLGSLSYACWRDRSLIARAFVV